MFSASERKGNGSHTLGTCNCDTIGRIFLRHCYLKCRIDLYFHLEYCSELLSFEH